jgi:hypothetical protein
MHFTVLMVGTQFGWEEVDELLFPYWFYLQMISDEEMRADPRFVFEAVNIEEEFEKWKLMTPRHEEEYKQYKNFEDWAEQQYLSYEKDLGWGRWHNPQSKGGEYTSYQIGGRWTGFFLLKEKTFGLLGRPGAWTKPPTDLRAADQARKCDIDWEAMRERGKLRGQDIYGPSDERGRSVQGLSSLLLRY